MRKIHGKLCGEDRVLQGTVIWLRTNNVLGVREFYGGRSFDGRGGCCTGSRPGRGGSDGVEDLRQDEKMFWEYMLEKMKASEKPGPKTIIFGKDWRRVLSKEWL